VLAVDGDPVHPVTGSRFPLAQGQRIDLMVTMPEAGGAVPVLAQREGDLIRTGMILATPDASIAKLSDAAESVAAPVDLSLEQRLVAQSPLAPRRPDTTLRVTLNGSMMPYVWSVDHRTWANHRPLRVADGQRVVLQMLNQSSMAHPMHLHGHHFQVVALNGQKLKGAMRDTVLVPQGGSVTVAFDANNPGRWLLHCHNLFHMARGMMTEIVYDRAPSL
jgi:FtsP/CotA-like multicopper oxidase with cupredoxin domain